MKRLLAALLFALPLAAQVPQCKVSQPAGNQASYSCSLAVQAGQTLVAPFVGSVKSISDSQQNVWAIDQQTLQLSFAHALNAAQTGSDVVTFTMTSPAALNAVVLAYPASPTVSVSSIANGSGTAPQSPSLAASAGSTAVAFGTQWTNSSEGPSAFPSGFAAESSGSVWVADESVSAAGNVSGSATYPNSVNWYAGIAVLTGATPPPPPPILSSFFFTAQLFSCTACTISGFQTAGMPGADWQPLPAASIYQGATITLYQVSGNSTSLICSATLNAQAIASCKNAAGINVAPSFLTLTYQITAPGGAVLVAAGSFSFSAPVASFTSAVNGTVTLYLGMDSATSAGRFGWVGTT